MPSIPGKRRQAREAAIQFLYLQDLHSQKSAAEIESFWAIRPLKVESRQFCVDLVTGVLQHLDQIDETLQSHVRNYRLERLAAVDRNILRLAVYEILFVDNIPGPVSMNEAIEIAKRFGTPESAGFVNGILDSVIRSTRTSTT